MKNTMLAILVMALFASCGTQTQIEPELTVLKGATAYDGHGGVIPNSRVVLRGGTIEAVGDSLLKIPENSEEIDLSGKFITPFMAAFIPLVPDASKGGSGVFSQTSTPLVRNCASLKS